MDSTKSTLAVRNGFLSARDSSSLSPAIVNLIIALMVLIFVGLLGLLTLGALYAVRKLRKSRAIKNASLPQYNAPMKIPANHRRLTISTTARNSNIYVYDEKSSLTSNSPRTPLTPDDVPEIRITFPDEQDESGRLKGGRVLLVRVGERGNVGLEPLDDEQLPAYEKESGDRFHSIDMERIGGLKEKSSWS